MMYKIKTFFRIQSRMALIYLEELYYLIEWPIRLIFNLAAFLTIPLWVGPFYMGMILFRAWQSKKNSERDVVTGRIWFFELYKLY